MNKYAVNFKKMALLLLPPDLRRPALAAILYAGMSALSRLHVMFEEFREDTDRRLAFNCQVCYLQALINDLFDPVSRRIYIEENDMGEDDNIIYMRSEDKAKHVPERASADAFMINRRGFGGINGYDFFVCVPYELNGQIDTARLKAIVKTYKLASKRFEINFV